MAKKRSLPVDTLVGQNVRSRRIARGASQTEMADAIGVTFQQVQKYEKGTNRMGASRLAQVATFLKVPVVALFEGARGANMSALDVSDSPSALLSQANVLRGAQAMAAIRDPETRRSLVGLLETIAARAARPH